MRSAWDNSERTQFNFHTRHLFIGAFVLALVWLAPRAWAEEGADLPIVVVTSEIPPAARPVQPTPPPIPLPTPCLDCGAKSPPPPLPPPVSTPPVPPPQTMK